MRLTQAYGFRAAILLSVLGGLAPHVVAAEAGGKAVQEISRLIDTYAQAVDAADPKLASEVWDTSPDVSFIHPLGHEHGWEAIKTNVFEKLMGETFSERKLTIRDRVIHADSHSAWAEFYWDFAAKLRKDGAPITTHGRETQVYGKVRGRWRLLHVHYSGMPALGPQGF